MVKSTYLSKLAREAYTGEELEKMADGEFGAGLMGAGLGAGGGYLAAKHFARPAGLGLAGKALKWGLPAMGAAAGAGAMGLRNLRGMDKAQRRVLLNNVRTGAVDLAGAIGGPGAGAAVNKWGGKALGTLNRSLSFDPMAGVAQAGKAGKGLWSRLGGALRRAV